jgi:hypothetical protein
VVPCGKSAGKKDGAIQLELEADFSAVWCGKCLHRFDFAGNAVDLLKKYVDDRGSMFLPSLKLFDPRGQVFIRGDIRTARSLRSTDESIATPS